LEDWNSYLKKLYEPHEVMDNFQALLTNEQVFSLEGIEFGIKCLANGKTKGIEGYQAKILKIEAPVLIPYIHNLFNMVVKHGFPKLWT